ncbi:Phage prohead protease, HK97 family [Deinococcus phoenicis]|uniref:Phage prohead protease, HK97 family n=1 Tax=Deinococcus phoenicis TaxID=1476583 RepID=A0A016QNE7_9DEIO|nr:HK97 family phage prohead protease [Deinococcus phoenicis]EYB67407.1 Phage prohead protease, HK97 family [Deinococcus phoenicis]
MTKSNTKDLVETKSLTIEVKAEGEGIITAYAAAFGNTDSYGDVIQRGAFVKTVSERKDKIKVLYNHDYYSQLPVGKPVSLVEDSYGLLTSTKMSQTQMGQDIYTLAQEGALDSMSIGYSAYKAEYPDDDASRQSGIWRVITEAKLYEYSFVPFPANEGAVITGIKSGADLEREIRRWKAITEVNLSTKAGRVLSAANAKKILSALTELQDLVSAAGLDEAADEGTSDTSTGDTKSRREPPAHSPLLSALQSKACTLDTEGRKSSILADLRKFGASLGGNP